jgi:two-component system NtrC family sensor kinase
MDILRTNMFRAERVAALGTMAAGISHEIRNPLAGLMNCLTRLSKNPDEATLRKYLPLMESASRHIQETVSRYLRFSSAPSQNPQPICVNKSAEIALSLVRPRLESRAIAVEVELEEGLPTVQGDSILLQQVLLNLLINAVDATDREGTISIRTFRQDGNVMLVVGDTGSGIRAEDLEKLFDPFFTTKEGSGTGLGLTISQEIIKYFKGSIRVASESGKGTTFQIQLPTGEG